MRKNAGFRQLGEDRMAKTLVLAEKPSVARELARVLGCKQSGEGYLDCLLYTSDAADEGLV